MNNAQLFAGLGLAFAGGAALGVGVGRYLTIKALDEKYNEQMEAEIARTRAFYQKVNDAGEDMSTPASAAEALGVSPDETLDAAADAVNTYRGKIDYTKFSPEVTVKELSLNLEENIFTKAGGIPPEEALKVEHNVFEDVVKDVEEYETAKDLGFSERTPDKPYLITMLEFAENETEYEQLSATYYAGDKVLTDDQDKPVNVIDAVIGQDNLEKFGTKRVIYVRNERLKTDYEVNLSDGKYAYEVAGFTHGDEIYQRMPRRRSADE